jgi:arylsulfatase A-like enzyme
VDKGHMNELPNIVMVVFDTARFDRFGCYGHRAPTTPTVDSLARQGMRVETMIANGPWTLPSHASLFTGLYPSQHGSQWQTGPRLRSEANVTLAEWLRGLGYQTVCATNNGLICERTGLSRGFDHYAFRLDLEHGSQRVTRRIKKGLVGGDSGGRVVNGWLSRVLPDLEGPLFLFVNYLECHWAYAPPPSVQRSVGGPRFGFLEGLRYRLAMADRVGPWEAIARADDRTLEIYSALYDGEHRNVDRHLHQLLDILTDTGHLPTDRSLVMVTSDHGEHLGEHGLADHHASLDDHLIRVPFVVWGPSVVPSMNREGLFELVDVMPSLSRLLGAELPAPYLEGRRTSLFDPSKRQDGEEYAFAEWRAWPARELSRLATRNPSYDFTGLDQDLICVRDQRFKLTRSSDGREVLHDLLNDPSEEADVGRAMPHVAQRLRERLDAALDSWKSWEQAPPALTPQEEKEIEERLSALGYI